MRPFFTGFLLSLSLCMDLGLVNIATLRISLARNATAGFSLGLGSLLGDLIYFSLAVFGATTMLGSRPVRQGLWILGTATLLFLAYRAVRDLLHPKFMETGGVVPRGSLTRLFLAGAGLSLASPSGILWFAAVGGGVIAGYGSAGGDNQRVLAVFGAGFATAGILWAAAFAFGAAALKKLLGWRFVRGLSLASAAIFLYLAVDVFMRGLREF